MGDVVELGCKTTADLPVEKVLSKAAEQGLTAAIVVGLTPDGSMYFALSSADAERAVFLLELAKAHVIQDAME